MWQGKKEKDERVTICIRDVGFHDSPLNKKYKKSYADKNDY